MRSPRRISIKLTDQLHRHLHGAGRAGNLTVVDEFPKSGGTWLAHLLADSTGLPMVDEPLLPVLNPAVVRVHWPPKGAARLVYCYRDGRDVLVSLFHHRHRHFEDPAAARARARLLEIFADGLDPGRIRSQLPRFLELELTTPLQGSSLTWPQHVAKGLASTAIITSYENLVRDTEGELSGILSKLDHNIPARRVDLAVEMNSLANSRLGATPGDRSFVRKGQPGEWREVFTAEAGRTFDRLCGQTLVDLGYEEDRTWWDGLPAD